MDESFISTQIRWTHSARAPPPSRSDGHHKHLLDGSGRLGAVAGGRRIRTVVSLQIGLLRTSFLFAPDRVRIDEAIDHLSDGRMLSVKWIRIHRMWRSRLEDYVCYSTEWPSTCDINEYTDIGLYTRKVDYVRWRQWIVKSALLRFTGQSVNWPMGVGRRWQVVSSVWWRVSVSH